MSDSHCHLDHAPLLDNLNDILNRSKEVGIKKLLTICTTLESFKNIENILTSDDMIYGTFGIHPYETENISFTPIQEDIDGSTNIILTVYPEFHEYSSKILLFIIINDGLLGDLNDDQILNIEDIILMVNMILDLIDDDIDADMNEDGGINILDIAILINLILN